MDGILPVTKSRWICHGRCFGSRPSWQHSEKMKNITSDPISPVYCLWYGGVKEDRTSMEKFGSDVANLLSFVPRKCGHHVHEAMMSDSHLHGVWTCHRRVGKLWPSGQVTPVKCLRIKFLRQSTDVLAEFLFFCTLSWTMLFRAVAFRTRQSGRDDFRREHLDLLWEMTSGRSFSYQMRVSARVVGLFLTSFSFANKKVILSSILANVFCHQRDMISGKFFFPFYGHGHMDVWAWDIVYVHVYSEIRNKVTKKNRSRGMDVVPDRDVMKFGHNLGLEILELKMWIVIRALIRGNSQEHWGMSLQKKRYFFRWKDRFHEGHELQCRVHCDSGTSIWFRECSEYSKYELRIKKRRTDPRKKKINKCLEVTIRCQRRASSRGHQKRLIPTRR